MDSEEEEEEPVGGQGWLDHRVGVDSTVMKQHCRAPTTLCLCFDKAAKEVVKIPFIITLFCVLTTTCITVRDSTAHFESKRWFD